MDCLKRDYTQSPYTIGQPYYVCFHSYTMMSVMLTKLASPSLCEDEDQETVIDPPDMLLASGTSTVAVEQDLYPRYGLLTLVLL